MGLTNAKYYQQGHFFWDERSLTLEEQVLEPIQNEVEMGLTLAELVTDFAEHYYTELFTLAFEDALVTTDRSQTLGAVYTQHHLNWISSILEGRKLQTSHPKRTRKADL